MIILSKAKMVLGSQVCTSKLRKEIHRISYVQKASQETKFPVHESLMAFIVYQRGF